MCMCKAILYQTSLWSYGIMDTCIVQLCLAISYKTSICSTMGIQDRRSLSTERGFLIVSFAHTTTKKNRAFSVFGSRSGMGNLCHCDCFLGLSLTILTLILKKTFLFGLSF